MDTYLSGKVVSCVLTLLYNMKVFLSHVASITQHTGVCKGCSGVCMDLLYHQRYRPIGM